MPSRMGSGTVIQAIAEDFCFHQMQGEVKRVDIILLCQCIREKSVLFFDLDGLKTINDTLGHEAGDTYIKTMADILKENKEEGDIICRYGGDEYIVVSKQASWEASIRKLECIQTAIVEPVSASAGCVFEKITDISQLKGLIEQADKKMYEYKKKKKVARV